MSPNVFILAADNDPSLIPLLREHPSLASAQDEHGYSLIHAATSYNHIDLLRILVKELDVDVNLRDEDDETALFVAETQEAAMALVEELGIDVFHRGADGLTAREKIASEGDFPSVVDYLTDIEANRTDKQISSLIMGKLDDINQPQPADMKLTAETNVATGDVPSTIDTVLRCRIEELARRGDFSSQSTQADLRQLIENAVLELHQRDKGDINSERK